MVTVIFSNNEVLSKMPNPLHDPNSRFFPSQDPGLNLTTTSNSNAQTNAPQPPRQNNFLENLLWTKLSQQPEEEENTQPMDLATSSDEHDEGESPRRRSSISPEAVAAQQEPQLPQLQGMYAQLYQQMMMRRQAEEASRAQAEVQAYAELHMRAQMLAKQQQEQELQKDVVQIKRRRISSQQQQHNSAQNLSRSEAAVITQVGREPVFTPPPPPPQPTNERPEFTQQIESSSLQNVSPEVTRTLQAMGLQQSQKLATFRAAMLSSMDANGRASRGSRGARRDEPELDDGKDPEYRERRRKNNEAARRSRETRRAKEQDVAVRAAFFEQETGLVSLQLARVTAECEALRKKVEELEEAHKK